MMFRALLSMYQPKYATTLVYMLQGVEYKVGDYLKWLHRTKDFSAVMYRRKLDQTYAARLLLIALRVGILAQIMMGLVCLILGLLYGVGGILPLGAALIISYPLTWAYLLVVPIILGRLFISQPAESKLIQESKAVFANHKAIKIAVAGSYGKTSMKELLSTVLSEGLNVAATPANKNVSASHAYFARKLTGKEEVLIIEYGEGAPGDVERFAAITQPTHAVITGLAPAHLDRYKTLEAAGKDIFSVASQVGADKAYINSDSPEVKPFLKPSYSLYDNHGALGWKVSEVRASVTGTSFIIKKGGESLKLSSGLVGAHQIGFLAFVAAFALELGLTHNQVKAGLAKTTPFEHRMQPYKLAGAWVIDDTYNGNLEGIRAGTSLLAQLPAKRKIYVTPGLVDQGAEAERVHVEAGKLIAAAAPNIVVLMRNSVTNFIKEGLEKGNYKGQLRIEDRPLEFYTNLKHFVADGDLVVMQNDWTDNYA